MILFFKVAVILFGQSVVLEVSSVFVRDHQIPELTSQDEKHVPGNTTALLMSRSNLWTLLPRLNHHQSHPLCSIVSI